MRAPLRALALGLALASSGLVGCGAKRSRAALPPPRGVVVATVEGVAITDQEVALVARSERRTPREALERLIREHLLAREAERRRLVGPEARRDAAWRASIQLLLAREVEDRYRPETVPEEVERYLLGTRRAELLNDGLVRVAHFVALAPATATPAAREAAHALAQRARERVLAEAGPTPTLERFQAVLAPFVGEHGRIETLPPVASTGLDARGNPFDTGFVDRAWALSAEAPLSEPFLTPFGWHVVLWLERLPGEQRTLSQARAIVRRDAVLLARGESARTLLQHLRARYRTELFGTTRRLAP